MSLSARDTVLGRLGRSGAPARPEPSRDTASWSTYGDPRARFSEALREAHGVLVDAPGSLAEALSSLPVYRQAQRLWGRVEGAARRRGDSAALANAGDAEGVDVCILRGELGVAENGAVWVTDRDLPERALLFLCEHLIIVLDPRSLVSHMGEAYRRLDVGSERFGCFVSGPSKTADIEQALVVGAHGPRSLHVVLHEFDDD